jgi:hypothetical protein
MQRERERKWGVVVVRDTTIVGWEETETIFAV